MIKKDHKKDLETIKADDPKKLVTENSDSLTSVSVASAKNTELNAVSAIETGISVVYPNEITESAILPGGEEAAPTAYQARSTFTEYTVQPGDTISSIARAFGLRTETLLADADYDETIKPGSKIGIPAADAPIHKVAHNHTLADIMQRYGATDAQAIIEANGLPADGTVQPGQVLLVVGGKIEDKPEPPPAPTTTRLASASRSRTSSYSRSSSYTSSASSSSSYYRSSGGSFQGFPSGYCTNYVAQKRASAGKPVAWRGNGGQWAANAKGAGYTVTGTPSPGDIMVTNESGWGHVAYVESVNSDGSVNVSEMNYTGFNQVSTRTVNPNSGMIKGFIK